MAEEGVEDDSWREAWDQREVLSNLYEEEFCELRRQKKFKEEEKTPGGKLGLFWELQGRRERSTRWCICLSVGGREDRRGRRRPIDGAEGWCEEEAESLAEGHGKLEGGVSAAVSVHRPPSQSPTKPCSLCLSRFLPVSPRTLL